jgi:acyl phosphate:glycerol-3-phosphate acyltransferase
MIFYLLFSFLIGSFPTAALISKLKGIDIKKVGSGNSGATNVLRTVGWPQAVIVMLIDILKGFLAVYSIQFFSALTGSEIQYFSIAEFSYIGGIVSVLGHIFSPFLKFHGGKGVATSMGIYLCISYLTGLSAFFLSLILVYIFKKASVGTLIAVLSLPLFFYMFDSNHTDFSFILKLIFFNIAIIFYSHRENIKRIIDGTELNLKK